MSQEFTLRSDQCFRALIEHSSDAIVLLTAEGTVTYASPATERVSGYRSEELVGSNGLAFLHPDDREAVQQRVSTLLDQPGNVITVECRLSHTDGTRRWMEATLTNLLHAPAVQAVLCTYRDITQRKQEQEHLRQSEERYRVLVEEAGVGLFVTDLHDQYVEVNEMGCQFSGYSREELLTMHIPDLVSEDDLAALPATLARMRSGEFKHNRWRMKRKDGSLLPVGMTGNLLSTGHLLAIVRDISDQMRAEEARRQWLAYEQAVRAEAQAQAHAAELSAILEAITDGVLVCDASAEIRYINAAFRSMLAMEEDADPSVLRFEKRMEWLALRDIEGRPLPREQFATVRLLRGERLSDTDTTDFLCRTHTGEDMIVNVSGAPIREASGQIVGAVIGLRDVTERRKLERQLQYSERKLRSLVESNIFGMLVADGAGRIYETNERYAQMVGYSQEELLSGAVRWQHLNLPEYQEVSAQACKDLQTTGIMLPHEKEYLRKDGSRLPILMAGAMIDRERDLVLMVTLDISERKAAERRKEEFLGMVSHELRSPLTVILGSLEIALLQLEGLLRALAPEAKELLTQIEHVLTLASGQVEIETRLVDELLDVSRLETPTFEVSVRRENLVAIVQETVGSWQRAAPLRGIELVLPSQEQVPVLVDAGRIGQVLTNYLTNALKYAPGEQPIGVRLEVEASMARVSVRDQGPGLTPEQQQRVWERFYQAAAPGQGRPAGGLGLGLAIVKAIVEKHQGHVGVESAPGQGATFWFVVPLADERNLAPV